MNEITVFLSGTRRDLKRLFGAARKAINALPGYRAVDMADFPAEDISPEEWSRREASRYALYVGLLGHYYGTLRHDVSKSNTEQEYDTATSLGIPRLIFFTDHSIPELTIEQDDEARRRIRAFRDKVHERVYGVVQSPSAFASGVVRALQNWEADTMRGSALAVTEFYEPFLRQSLIHGHTVAFVGREDVLLGLDAFVASDRRVLVLHAPWGRGKSRVLIEWAKGRGATHRIRFIREDADITPEALKVSAVDPLTLVLEDFQRRDKTQVSTLLAHVRRCAPCVKIIMTTRSSILGEVEDLTRYKGFDAREMQTVEVPALSPEAHRQLVAGILEEDGPAASAIATRTKDHVLAAIIAARLLKEGRLTLADVERSTEFEYHVLHMFREALYEVVLPEERAALESLLGVIAIAGPVRPDDGKAMDAVAAFVGLKKESVFRLIVKLEKAGHLIRRGGQLRIPVDAVNEAVVLSACITSAGDVTGFADRVLAELWEPFGPMIARSLAIADWDARRRGLAKNLLAGTWERLEREYSTEPEGVLEVVSDIGPYQPEATLEFVAKIIGHKGSRSRDRLLADALRAGPLHVPGLIEPACDLLWKLAKDNGDQRSEPEKTLREIGEYVPGKRIEINEALMRWCERRARGSDAIPGNRIAEYLRALLDKETDFTWGDGHKVHMHSMVVHVAATTPIRKRALDLLEGLATDSDGHGAGVAIRVLGHALEEPPGLFGRAVSEKENAAWADEYTDALRRFAAIRSARGSRAIDIAILKEIAWQAEYGSHPEAKGAAAVMVAEIRAELIGSPEFAITPSWEMGKLADPEYDAEHDDAIREIARATRIADVDTWLAGLWQILAYMRALGLQPEPSVFLRSVCTADPNKGKEIIQVLLDGEYPGLEAWIGVALVSVLEADASVGQELFDAGLRSTSVVIVCALAQVLGWLSVGRVLPEAYLEEAYRALLLVNADGVRRCALASLAYGKTLPNAKRLDLLLAYDPAPCPHVEDKWVDAIAVPKLYVECTPDQAKQILANLMLVPELDYAGTRILGNFSAAYPMEVVDLMLKRVAAAKSSRREYEAIPRHHAKEAFAPLPTEAKTSLLVKLGPLLTNRNYAKRSAAEELFSVIAGCDSGAMREVRLAWAASNEEASIRQCVSSLGHEKPEVLLDEEEIITKVVESAAGIRGDLLADVSDELRGLFWSGVRHGLPAERDIAIRDRAREASARLRAGSVAAEFYRSLAEMADASIARDTRRKEEEEW